MENNKPRLSLDEQIQHLKDKGILFAKDKIKM